MPTHVRRNAVADPALFVARSGTSYAAYPGSDSVSGSVSGEAAIGAIVLGG